MRTLTILPGLFRASALALALAAAAQASRIKDVAKLDGLAETQLIGYGLVVGLKSTGDGPRTQFTTQSVVNMLRNTGIEVPRERIQVRNVAAVMVTSKLSPFMKRGSNIDVTVSSIGDAKSLEGGTLLMSPLQATDGEIYALAQGALSIGGLNKEGSQGKTSYSKNHTLVGEIPNGAIIQKEAPGGLAMTDELRISLANPDFSSAVAMAKAINANFKKPVAEAKDPVTVAIAVPEEFKSKRMEFIAEVENLDFLVSTVAKVVLNEKTGTVIAGGNVSISEVAVSQGSITIQITQNQQAQVSNTNAANSGTTQLSNTTSSEDIKVDEPKAEMKVLPTSSNVADLAKSLNSLGVTPRDIIAIFQAIKRAGALNAELIVM
ncbi:MAG TPA: flagellar basal body P-ring protein FlgI [Fibrobacteria bacterium]|nr:flagellar basal body P-ring protein FlgI [Fibrobacteria bacterium]